MCVNQRLDVYHINYIFNYRDSENYGNNICGIHKRKIFFSEVLNFLLLRIFFLFLPIPIHIPKFLVLGYKPLFL
jgi:hypothetical protein